MPPKDKGVGKSSKKVAEKRKSSEAARQKDDTGLGDEITLSQNTEATPKLLQQVLDAVPKKRAKAATSTPVQRPRVSQVMDLFGDDSEAEEDPGEGTSTREPRVVGEGAVHYVNGREDGRAEATQERDEALDRVEDLENSNRIYERALQDSRNRYYIV